MNYLQPICKLVTKDRDGAKVRRQYDAAQTPYQRVLADQHVDEHVKATLTEHDEGLHPAQVKLAMEGSRPSCMAMRSESVEKHRL
ncbi:MAG: hypothetical protein U0821_07005 [Chloroflexota bacterium]